MMRTGFFHWRLCVLYYYRFKCSPEAHVMITVIIEHLVAFLALDGQRATPHPM